MYLFYKSDLGNSYLEAEESFYANKVLRLQLDDEFMTFDGLGHLQKAICTSSSSKKVELRIIENIEYIKPKRPYFHIAIAPTKKTDRIEWFVEKVIEMGIDEISFIKCRNSVRDKLNLERIRKIMLSAARQSGNLIFPKINELVPFKKFIENVSEAEKYIAHLNDENQKSLQDIDIKADSILIIIGPEGDFTNEEVSLAQNSDFYSLSLGKSRLRTETAGILSCAQLNYRFNQI